MVVDAGGVDDARQHGAVGVCDLLAQDLEIGGLRVSAVTEGMAKGRKVLGAAVRAGEHDDSLDPGQFPCPALADHPGEELLQDKTALAVCYQRNAGCPCEGGRVVDGQASARCHRSQGYGSLARGGAASSVRDSRTGGSSCLQAHRLPARRRTAGPRLRCSTQIRAPQRVSHRPCCSSRPPRFPEWYS
jgi:hypothetical protein